MDDKQTIAFIGNRYRLLEPLGTGGMGEVYRAYDRLRGKDVALKRIIPPAALQGTTESIERENLLALTHEFRLLASLRHPNIVSVLDYGVDAAHQPFFTMELLAAPQDVVSIGRTLPISGRVGLLLDILAALRYLHRHGIVHRDLKPSNIVIPVGGGLKVLDFGLALKDHTQKMPIAGSILYIAPEILRGDAPSEATDLYAVGVIAYELFMGERPLNALTLDAFLDALFKGTRDDNPLIEAAGVSLAGWIKHLLATKPTTRFPSALAAALSLQAAAVSTLPETYTVRESFLAHAPFIGRENELAQLEAALTAVEGGKGTARLIGGEAGIGKSRLLEELRIRALVRGIQVLRGQAQEGRGIPHALLRGILAPLVIQSDLSPLEAGVLKTVLPEINTLLDQDIPDIPILEAPHDGIRLFQVIRGLLERQTSPLLILLEDIHWAEDDTDLIHNLFQLALTRPIAIMATYRSDDYPHFAETFPPGTTHLNLKRLPPAAIASLTTAMVGESGRNPQVVSFVADHSEGNIFFAIDVLHILAETAGSLDFIGEKTLPSQLISKHILSVVHHRLTRLPAAFHPSVRFAAVLGRTLDLDVIACYEPGLNLEHWLSACADAHIVEVDGYVWRFSHDKIREGLLYSLENTERLTLNRTAAQIIERLYPESPAHAMRLLYHWRAAGDAAKTLHYIQQATEGHRLQRNLPEALRLLEEGLALIPPQDIARRVIFLRLKGQYLTKRGDLSAAPEVFQEALSLLPQAENFDPSQKGKLLLGFGNALLRAGRFAESEKVLEEGLALHTTLNDPVGLAAGHYALAYFNHIQGRTPQSLTNYEQALAGYQHVGDIQNAATCAWECATSLTFLGDYPRAEVYFEQSYQLCSQIGDDFGKAYIDMGRGRIAFFRREYEAAIVYLSASLERFRQYGNRYESAMCAKNLGIIARRQGRFEEARTYLEESLALRRAMRSTHTLVIGLGKLAALHIDIDNLAEARTLLLEAMTIIPSIGDVMWVKVEIMTSLAAYAFALGQRAKAAIFLRIADAHPFEPDHQNEAALLWERFPKAQRDALRSFPALENGRSLDEVLSEAAAWLERQGG